MSDETTPDKPAPAAPPPATAPEPAAAEEHAAAAGPAPAAYGPPPRRWAWRSRRVPLLIAGGLLVVGCLCGVGGVAIGALIGGHDGGRSFSDDNGRFGPGGRDGRGFDGDRGGRGFGRDGGPRGNATPAPATTDPASTAPIAPTTVAPAPSTS